MNKKTLLLSLLALSFFCTGYSQTLKETRNSKKWIELPGNFGEDKNVFFIKSKYLIKEDNFISIWVKQFSTSKTPKNKYHSTVLYNLNCDTKKSKVEKIIIHNLKGDITSSRSPREEWSFPVPETAGETILNCTCELFNDK